MRLRFSHVRSNVVGAPDVEGRCANHILDMIVDLIRQTASRTTSSSHLPGLKSRWILDLLDLITETKKQLLHLRTLELMQSAACNSGLNTQTSSGSIASDNGK